MPKSPSRSKSRSLLRSAADASAVAARTVLLVAIRGYQVALRPLFGPACRFAPSCSCYAEEAIRGHGVARGVQMAVMRIARCHPWNPGGYDPVPRRSL